MLGILTLVAFSVGNYLYDIEVGKNNGIRMFRLIRTST